VNSPFSLSQACNLLGYSRQAYYKRRSGNKINSNQVLSKMLVDVTKARIGCPTSGCRKIYDDHGGQWPVGRDKSISMLIEAGFGVRRVKKYHRATQAGTREFANLLVNKSVNQINQVWQSDMAYYLVGNKRFYTIYITDVYSQEVVGYGAYTSNTAENYAEVLNRAIKAQNGPINGLIHHSDGGKQYESGVYKSLCEKHGIQQSMCMYSYENPFAEKTNDLINNGYLNSWKPNTLQQVRTKQSQAVKDHNLNSRKKRLGKLSPINFRKMIKRQPVNQNPWLELKPANPVQPRNKVLNLN
jgi:putative transposase